PLEDRPEAFDGLGVDRTDNVLFGAVHDCAVPVLAKATISDLFVGREQTDLSRNRFAHEFLQIRSREAIENARDDIALALDRADDDRLDGLANATASLALVTVALFATDEGFVHLDNPHQFAEFLVLQGRADAMTDVPSGFVRAEAHVALNLEGADALLRAEHQVDDLEPVAEVNLRVLKDRADEMREAIGITLATLRALPAEFHRLKRVNLLRAAARARNALRPTVLDQ